MGVGGVACSVSVARPVGAAWRFGGPCDDVVDEALGDFGRGIVLKEEAANVIWIHGCSRGGGVCAEDVTGLVGDGDVSGLVLAIGFVEGDVDGVVLVSLGRIAIYACRSVYGFA